MKTYKVNIAGIEMILPEEALEYIQNRNWEYIEVELQPTHSIQEFMQESLTEILKNQTTQ
jgi:hypothetical protein